MKEYCRHQEEKKAFRKKVRQELSLLEPQEIRVFSARIVDRLFDYLQRKSMHRPLKVGVFHPLANEVNLVPLMTMLPGIEWYFPRCTGERQMVFHRVSEPSVELTPGFKGLLEPAAHLPVIEPSQLDVIITPGTAFSPRGHRIGKGGGFYDEFFKKSPGSLKVGVAFPGQLCEYIPVSDHDEPVDHIVTPDHSTLPRE